MNIYKYIYIFFSLTVYESTVVLIQEMSLYCLSLTTDIVQGPIKYAYSYHGWLLLSHQQVAVMHNKTVSHGECNKEGNTINS